MSGAEKPLVEKPVQVPLPRYVFKRQAQFMGFHVRLPIFLQVALQGGKKCVVADLVRSI